MLCLVLFNVVALVFCPACVFVLFCFGVDPWFVFYYCVSMVEITVKTYLSWLDYSIPFYSILLFFPIRSDSLSGPFAVCPHLTSPHIISAAEMSDWQPALLYLHGCTSPPITRRQAAPAAGRADGGVLSRPGDEGRRDLFWRCFREPSSPALSLAEGK